MIRSYLAVAVWTLVLAEDVYDDPARLQLQEAATLTSFYLGKPGTAPGTARVQQVSEGRVQMNGVQVGKVVNHIDGRTCSKQLLHEKANGDENYEVGFNQSAVVKIAFGPGKLGLTFGEGAGEISRVEDGQARIKGVKKGMVVTKIDRRQFSFQLLSTKVRGKENYTLTFAKDASHVVFTNAWDEVASWMQKNGATVRSAKVAEVQNGGNRLRGVISVEAIARGRYIMAIPENLWLTSEKLFALSNLTNESVEACGWFEGGAMHYLGSAVGLVSELRKKDQSFYAPYFKNMPSLSDYKSFFPYFADSRLLADFEGLQFPTLVAYQQHQNKRLQTCFNQWRNDPNNEILSDFTWDEVLTAMIHLRTRVFEYGTGPAFHNQWALMPAADWFNAAKNPNAGLRVVTSGNEHAGGDRLFMVYTTKNVSAGEEMHVEYDSKADNSRLFWWGMYMEDNENPIAAPFCPEPGSVDWTRIRKHAKRVLDLNGAWQTNGWTAPRCKQDMFEQPQSPIRCLFARLAWEICGSTWNRSTRQSSS